MMRIARSAAKILRAFLYVVFTVTPNAYTRNIMPANRSHLPTPQMVNDRLSYLQLIADKLMPLHDCQIDLLIGYGCPKALLPTEVNAPVGEGYCGCCRL